MKNKTKDYISVTSPVTWFLVLGVLLIEYVLGKNSLVEAILL